MTEIKNKFSKVVKRPPTSVKRGQKFQFVRRPS